MVNRTVKNKSWQRHVTDNARWILLLIVLIFAFGAVVVGEIFNAYGTIWWWDNLIHTFGGLILGLIGMLLIYFFNVRYSLRLNPLLVALFSFSFAISALVLWEVFEFTGDALFKTDMQRWTEPSNFELIGRSYQGTGLRDTMSDLIVGWIGAMIAAVIAYFGSKSEQRTVVGAMRRVFARGEDRQKK